MSQPESPADKIVEIIVKVLMAGSLATGGGFALSHVQKEELLEAALSLGIGFAVACGFAFISPLSKLIQSWFSQAGERATDKVESAGQSIVARVLSMEERYFKAQANDCEIYKTKGLRNAPGIQTLMLKDVFVPLELDRSLTLPGFRESDLSVIPSENQQVLDIWQLLARNNDKRFRQIAILAWGGFGKTTLLRHITYVLGTNQQGEKNPKVKRFIPVLLLLRKYRDILTAAEPVDLPTLIQKDHLANIEGDQPLDMPDDWAETQLKKGKILVMLDGFDEVAKEKRPLVAQWLNRQLQRYPKSTFILTARPKAYLEQHPADPLQFRSVLYVRPFNRNQREEFVQKWYRCQESYHYSKRETEAIRTQARRVATQLLEQIEQRKELLKLASNPLLLTMLARFYWQDPSIKLPKRRPELYQKICTLQLKDRPNAKQLEALLPNCEAQDILQMLALEMMQQKEERLDKDLLLERLTNYLRLQDETVTAAVFLEEIEQISELLVQREPDEYEFAHLSFQEFLAAREIIRQKQENLLQAHFQEDWWKQTILLYVGQVKKPSQMIRAIREAGSTQLAYDCMQETTKRIDDDLKQDLEELISLENEQQQVTAERYQKLEQLLIEAQTDVWKWKEADDETYRLMITAIGKEEGQGFSEENLGEFPCNELKKIDHLWVQHSNGLYGFSVQKDIYVQCGGTLDYKIPSTKVLSKFYEAIAWYEDGEFKVTWNEILMSNRRMKVQGHLPLLAGMGWDWRMRYGGVNLMGEGLGFGKIEDICKVTLFSRIPHCEL